MMVVVSGLLRVKMRQIGLQWWYGVDNAASKKGICDGVITKLCCVNGKWRQEGWVMGFVCCWWKVGRCWLMETLRKFR